MTTVDIPTQIAANITAQIEKDAFQKGRDEGEKLGLDKGLDKGRDEGEMMGVQRSLVRLYERRFGEMPKAIRAHIDNTNDVARLEAWHDLAITEPAQTIDSQILRDSAD